ncbi:MAG TPA: hypothetical protein VG672_13490, partial [Bryobacteraceae bacterium]|nr:hypothetical protein [Bryobacteraceae bacterium]
MESCDNAGPAAPGTPDHGRRRFLHASLAAAGLSRTRATAQSPAPPSTPPKPPFRLIFETEWNDMPCADYPLTRERWVEECIHPLMGTQVDAIFYNLCSSDGYVAELKSGELLMDSFPQLGDSWVWRYRENTKRLIAGDANPPKLAVE